MPELSTTQRTSIPLLLIVAAVSILGFVIAAPDLGGAAMLPRYWLALGGALVFAWYVFRGDLLSAVLFWFFTLICLHEEYWRESDVFFFALSIPRLLIVALVALFLAMWAVGRMRIRFAWPIGAIMAALTAYFTVSAMRSGWITQSPVSVHYRLVGGYLFPFVMFALLVHAFRTERDLRKTAVFFAGLAVYLTYTAWCEQLGLYRFVWPAYIADPEVGIHWGRVRGPFVSSPAMGLALVYCFFSNLVLARKLTPAWRWALYGLNALMLPAMFWTKTRSVWLAFLLALIIWVLYSRRRATRIVSVCGLATLLIVTAVLNLSNIVTEEREKGGWTDVEPILLRVGLAQMTASMVADHPLTGVGFGHFRDHAPHYARDPGSPYFAFSSTALEHNNFLSVAAETGLIGLALYTGLIVALLALSVRLYRLLPASATGFINRDFIVLYWVLAGAYLIDGSFRETSDNPFANCLFFGLSAAIVALNILLSPEPIRARPGFTHPPGIDSWSGVPARLRQGGAAIPARRPDGGPLRAAPMRPRYHRPPGFGVENPPRPGPAGDNA